MDTTGTLAVAAFAETARAFCDWCENLVPGPEVNSQAASWLCRLYCAALTLPKVQPDGSDGPPDPPAASMARVKENLAIFRGWYYREYFDPDPTRNDESGMGDIGDDLHDTYKDVRAGLVLYDQGRVTDAAWQWAFGHRVHWGRHAVGALFALHCMAISKWE